MIVMRNGEPSIDLEMYLKRLALVSDHTVIARSEQELSDLKQVAKWISDVASRGNQTLSQLFQAWDENQDGYIDYEEVCAHASRRPYAALELTPSLPSPNSLSRAASSARRRYTSPTLNR